MQVAIAAMEGYARTTMLAIPTEGSMGHQLMLYPNVLQLLALQHGLSIECAHQLWDEATAQSTLPVGLSPEDTPEWDSVMSRFLESIRCDAHART